MSSPSMPGSFTSPETIACANRLHELCAAGKYDQAMAELYADNARHVEAMEMPGSPFKRIMEGKPLLLKMSDQFGRMNTIHSANCGAPMFNGDQFICEMSIDMTCKEGPMAGQRMSMREFCLYTVKGGRIAEAVFFYGAGNCDD
ncbi:MAG: SnoaL-like domain-containing protein [Phycisphaerales bacterium]